MEEFIGKVAERNDLTEQEAEEAMGMIMRGEATPSQIAGYITALRMKGETPAEITGSARAMRRAVVRVYTDNERLVDTCGTGGDGAGTFNISTTTAFVVAGAGLRVAKHGNRSVSSKSGSADVLEALGVKIDIAPEEMGRCIKEVGMGFLYAPRLHPAMKHAAGPRRELGIRTIFNVLGPLTNPADARFQLLGVFHPLLTETLAQVLANLGTERALVVHGDGGLDEMTVTGPTRVSEVYRGRVHTYTIRPEDYDLEMGTKKDLKGGTAVENAEITRRILQGAGGPRRAVVLLNAAAALLAGGVVESIKDGIQMAADSIDSGAALKKLELLREYTRSVQ